MRKETRWVVGLLGLVGCGGVGPVEGDTSCLEQRTRPEPGQPVTVAYTVQDPDGVPIPDVEVHVFAGDVVTEGCGEGCEALVADANGVVEITAPSGWIAYRTVGEDPSVGKQRRMDTVEVHSNHPPLPGEEAFLNAIFRDSMGALFSIGGAGKVDDALGMLVGRGVDCGDVPLANLHPRIFTADGTELLELADAYLNKGGGFPARGRRGTNIDGRAFVANLPPDEGLLRLELWGSPDGSDLEQRYTCEELPIFADTVTTGRQRPLRADAPASCL